MNTLAALQTEPLDLEELQDKLDKLTASLELSDIHESFVEWNRLRDSYLTHYSLAEILFSLETDNKEQEAKKIAFDELDPEIEEKLVAYSERLLAHTNYPALESQHGPLLTSILKQKIRAFDPAIKKHLVREKELENAYTKLTAAIRFSFKGEEHSISTIGKYCVDADREVRYEAHTLLAEGFQQHQQKLDEIFDELVKLRHDRATILGYPSNIEYSYDQHLRLDYGPAEVATFRQDVVTHLLPQVAKWREEQQEKLGLSKLMSWDLAMLDNQAPPKPIGDDAYVLKKSAEMYQQFSPETATFYQEIEKQGLLDVTARPGKGPGGYCTSLPSHGLPFVFANFNGTAGDVVVMTHECGHALQYWMSAHHPLEDFRWPTKEACEVHSMGMEYLTFPWMELFFGEDAERYRQQHIQKALTMIPYTCAVDHFQQLVYENPDWTPTQRNEAWQEMEKRYLPDRDYGDIAYWSTGAFWQKQLHIYLLPFYYIDYALAELCALQFLDKADKDREAALQDYSRICKVGGSMTFLQMLEEGKVRSPFEATTFTSILATVAP